SRLVLLRQYRSGSETVAWRFPTGTMEAFETPESAAYRELREETGLVATTLTSLGYALRPSGWIRQRTWFFAAPGLAWEPAARDVSEPLEVLTRSRADVAALLSAHEFDQLTSRAVAAYLRS